MRRIKVTKRHTIELKETKWDILIWLGTFVVLGFVLGPELGSVVEVDRLRDAVACVERDLGLPVVAQRRIRNLHRQ